MFPTSACAAMGASLSRPLLGFTWVAVAAMIGPRLASLYRIAHPSGRKLLGQQLVLLLLLRLKWLRSRLPEFILEPPIVLVPLMTIGALFFRLSRRTVLGTQILRCLVAYGAIPVITEAIDKMQEDISDADHPALLAMMLGLLMNEPSAAAVRITLYRTFHQSWQQDK